MEAFKMKRRSVLLGGLSMAGAALAGCQAETGPSTSGQTTGRNGVVLMHGKQGSPQRSEFIELRRRLSALGQVSTPEMAWSRAQYFTGNAAQPLDQIAGEAARLRARGAEKIFMAGHSMGANYGLSYAAHRGGVAGVVMLAPGHGPGENSNAASMQESIARARQMVAEGRGREIGGFVDFNTGRVNRIPMPAEDYLTWQDANGYASMVASARRLPRGIPVFMAIGSRDMAVINSLAREVFAALPPNPRHRFVELDEDHYSAALAAAGSAVSWAIEVARDTVAA